LVNLWVARTIIRDKEELIGVFVRFSTRRLKA
jgi:hypothetical protein